MQGRKGEGRREGGKEGRREGGKEGRREGGKEGRREGDGLFSFFYLVGDKPDEKALKEKAKKLWEWCTGYWNVLDLISHKEMQHLRLNKYVFLFW
jgi:hypothetical protein